MQDLVNNTIHRFLNILGLKTINNQFLFSYLLSDYGIRASMGDVGACWDNAVVERFFGSLKHVYTQSS
ncbi:MAG: hypothetical protein LC437_02210 [Thiohalomonas sp.]|nr:hypothetical protein [Thiohalomonas sp.]